MKNSKHLNLTVTLILLFLICVLILVLKPNHYLKAKIFVKDKNNHEKELISFRADNISFNKRERLKTYISSNWKTKEFGFPVHYPAYALEIEGFLYVEETKNYTFILESDGKPELSFNSNFFLNSNNTPRSLKLEKGLNKIYLKCSFSPQKGRLILHTVEQDRKKNIISKNLLYPPDYNDGFPMSKRIFSLFILLLSIVPVLILKIYNTSFLDYMISTLEGLYEYRIWFFIVLVLGLSLCLRLHDYYFVPVFQETADEYFHGWNGYSLIHDRIPKGWSWFAAYTDYKDYTWFDAPFRIVKPWFDQPFTFSLIIGAAATLGGAEDLFDCSLKHMRIPPILISVLTTLMVFLLAKLIFENELTGILAALIHATLPNMVVVSRLVKSDGLVALLLLTSIYYAFLFVKTKISKYLYFASIAAGLSSMSKMFGITSILVVFIILLAEKRSKCIPVFLAISIAMFSTYFIYGAVYDWGLFCEVLKIQGSKMISLDSIVRIFTQYNIVLKEFGSGWLVWLWLVFIYISVKKRNFIFPTIAFIYLAMLVLTVDIRWLFGWYQLPLTAFFAVSGGYYLKECLDDPNMLNISPLYFLCILPALKYMISPELFGSTIFIRSCVLSFLGVFLLKYFNISRYWDKILRLVAFLLIIFFFYQNIRISLDFFSIYV